MKFAQFKSTPQPEVKITPIVSVLIPPRKGSPEALSEASKLGQGYCPLCDNWVDGELDARSGKMFYQCRENYGHFFVKNVAEALEGLS